MDILELPSLNFLEQVLLIPRPEGIIPLDHHIVEYAEGPHIGIDRDMVDLRDNLGSHVRGRSTESIDGIGRHTVDTEPEINQLQIFVPIDEDILSFDIAVDDVLPMQVADCLGDYLKEFLCFVFFETVFVFGEEIVVEGVGAAVLQD